MPFLYMNYIKNRYTWKECTGNFLIINTFVTITFFYDGFSHMMISVGVDG